MSLTKSTKTSVTKKRAHRELSNAIAMFDHEQIQDFRRAFNLVDQNNDGLIDKKDLHDMLISLGTRITYVIQSYRRQILYYYNMAVTRVLRPRE